MSKLDRSEKELAETKLDLEDERGTRRRLQQENKELQEKQGRRPFVVTLIDADADGYVVRRALRGSEIVSGLTRRRLPSSKTGL